MGREAHGGDLRKGRYSETGRIYLVTAVTEARKALFVDVGLGREVVRALRLTILPAIPKRSRSW